MNSLININLDKQTVSARELHEKLNIETRFNDWFPRMCEYGFIEGKDFYSKMSKTSELGGRPSKDAEISIDMAKQICMIQRTPEGKAVREYLIDLEKAWNTPEQVMARALKVADEQIKSLKERVAFLGEENEQKTLLIESMQPKVSYYDLILKCESLLTTSEIASDYGMSAKKFNKLLHEMHVQYKQSDRWYLYNEYEGNGYTQSQTHTFGENKAATHMYWTQKGRLFLYDFLKENGILPMIEREDI